MRQVTFQLISAGEFCTSFLAARPKGVQLPPLFAGRLHSSACGFFHLKAINYVCVFFRCQQDKSINYEILVNLLSLVAFYLTSHAFSCNSIYNNSANKKKVENDKVVALQ